MAIGTRASAAATLTRVIEEKTNLLCSQYHFHKNQTEMTTTHMVNHIVAKQLHNHWYFLVIIQTLLNYLITDAIKGFF